MNNFLRYFAVFGSEIPEKKVVKIKVKLKVKDVTGNFKFTDVMLQENGTLTGYIVHTSEMLKRNDNPVKHYNVLCRGNEKTVIINNDGNVTSGLDFHVKAKNGTTGPIKLETLYRTRGFHFKDYLAAGEELQVDSFGYKVNKAGEATNSYTGSFLGIPAGFGMYNVEMANRDMGRFVFYVKEYDKFHKT